MALVAVSVGAVAVVAQGQQNDEYQTGRGTVPDHVRERALAYVEAHFPGQVGEVYQQARTSLGYWHRVEPSNTRGRPMGDRPGDAAVFAVFFKGEFENHGPILTPGEPNVTRFNSGRVVADSDGVVVSLQMWQRPEDAHRPFGPAFDDQ